MYNKRKQFDYQFFTYGPKCKQNYILGYGGGGGVKGSSMIGLGLSCFPAILSPIYICTCQIRKQSDKKLLSLNSKYEEKNAGQ